MKWFKIGLCVVVLSVYTAIPVLVFTYAGSLPTIMDRCVVIYNDRGHGSGAIIGENVVLTAAHVAKMSGLKVMTEDGTVFDVVRSVEDKDSDLAVLYIDGKFNVSPLYIYRKPLKVGDEVLLVGTPLDRELKNLSLRGRVVGVDRQLRDQPDWNDAVILDAHAAPGCSGCPVLDSKGRIRAVLVGGVNVPLCIVIPVHNLDIDY